MTMTTLIQRLIPSTWVPESQQRPASARASECRDLANAKSRLQEVERKAADRRRASTSTR